MIQVFRWIRLSLLSRLALLLPSLLLAGFLTVGPPARLQADELNWAQQSFDPWEKPPKGLRNNISLEIINAIEGLFLPRFQHYFSDSAAYYVQLQLGSDLASGLHFFEEFQNLSYKRIQLGFELGLSSLFYARNSKITKDIRRWGSGIIFGLGLRFTYHNISGLVEDNILSAGIVPSLGWQLQSRNFSIAMYLELRMLLQFSTEGVIDGNFPIIIDRGPLGRALPNIPMLNSSLVSILAQNVYFTFSQTLNIRISYYF